MNLWIPMCILYSVLCDTASKCVYRKYACCALFPIHLLLFLLLTSIIVVVVAEVYGLCTTHTAQRHTMYSRVTCVSVYALYAKNMCHILLWSDDMANVCVFTVDNSTEIALFIFFQFFFLFFVFTKNKNTMCSIELDVLWMRAHPTNRKKEKN